MQPTGPRKSGMKPLDLKISRKSYELTNELVERYFGKVLAEQAVKVREEVRATMMRHYQDAEKLQQQGQIAHVELLNSKLTLSDAEREYQKIREAETISSMRRCSTPLRKKGAIFIQPVTNLFYLDSLEKCGLFLCQGIGEKSAACPGEQEKGAGR